MPSRLLLAELEEAVKTGTPEKRVDMRGLVTKLLLGDVDPMKSKSAYLMTSSARIFFA